MAGSRALSKVQLGLEVTAGTAVDATRVWRGPVAFPTDARTLEFPAENVGIIGGTTRTNTPKLQADFSFPATEATFEQLPYVLCAGIKNVTAGVADSMGSGYVYTYTLPTTALNTISSLTIEAGDNQRVDEVEFAFCRSFSLSGAAGEAMMVSSEWSGRQLTDAEFTTTGVTTPTVEEANIAKITMYVDDTTIGTTPVGTSVRNFTFNANTGWVARFGPTGNLYFAQPSFGEDEYTLNVTFDHDTTSEAELNAFRGESTRLVRLKAEGTALTTAGNYTYKSVVIDMAGKWEGLGDLGEDEGINTLSGTFRCRYDETAATRGSITVVNELANLFG